MVKDIPGFEGFYTVSSDGIIRSVDRFVNNQNGQSFIRGRLIKASPDRTGYLRVGLSKNGKVKTFSVHRLIAEAFIDNPLGYTEVNHIDHNKLNNRIGNLEWCSRKENMQKMRTHYTSIGTMCSFTKVNFCSICGKPFPTKKRNQKRCSKDCVRKTSFEKFNLTSESLYAQLKELTFVELASKYGVTDNAVRKWCQKLNIPSRSSYYRKYKNSNRN